MGVLKPKDKICLHLTDWAVFVIFRKKITDILTPVGWHFVGLLSPLKELVAKICELLQIRITKNVRIIQYLVSDAVRWQQDK